MVQRREINVAGLDAAHRRALEDVVGARLREHQRVCISWVEVRFAPSGAGQSIDDWTSVYESLTPRQKAAAARQVKKRANLSRPLP